MLRELAQQERLHGDISNYVRQDRPSFLEQRIVSGLGTVVNEYEAEDSLLEYTRNALRDRRPDHIIGTESHASTIKAYGNRLINIAQNGRPTDMARPYHGELEMQPGPADTTGGDNIKRNMGDWVKKAKYMHDLNKLSDALSDTALVEPQKTTREVYEMRRIFNEVGAKYRYGESLELTPSIINTLHTPTTSHRPSGFGPPKVAPEAQFDGSYSDILTDGIQSGGVSIGRVMPGMPPTSVMGGTRSISDLREDGFGDSDHVARGVRGAASSVMYAQQSRAGMTEHDDRVSDIAGIAGRTRRQHYQKHQAAAFTSQSDTKFVDGEGRHGMVGRHHQMTGDKTRPSVGAIDGKLGADFAEGRVKNTVSRYKTRSAFAGLTSADADLRDATTLSGQHSTISRRKLARKLTSAERLAMKSIGGNQDMVETLADAQIDNDGAHIHRVVAPAGPRQLELTNAESVGGERVFVYRNLVPIASVPEIRAENYTFDGFMHESTDGKAAKMYHGRTDNHEILRARVRDGAPDHDSTYVARRNAPSTRAVYKYEATFMLPTHGDAEHGAFDGAEPRQISGRSITRRKRATGDLYEFTDKSRPDDEE